MSVRPWFQTTRRELTSPYRCYFYEGLDGLSKLLLRPAHWHKSTPRGVGNVVWCRCQRVDRQSSHERGDLAEVVPDEDEIQPLTARARAALTAASAGFRLIFESVVEELCGS